MINISAFKELMCTTNIYESLLRTASTNLYLSISFIRLTIAITSAMMYFLQVSSLVLILTFALLKDMKSIPKTTSILMLTSRKI